LSFRSHVAQPPPAVDVDFNSFLIRVIRVDPW
jgi:hypothetical protein